VGEVDASSLHRLHSSWCELLLLELPFSFLAGPMIARAVLVAARVSRGSSPPAAGRGWPSASKPDGMMAALDLLGEGERGSLGP